VFDIIVQIFDGLVFGSHAFR